MTARVLRGIQQTQPYQCASSSLLTQTAEEFGLKKYTHFAVECTSLFPNPLRVGIFFERTVNFTHRVGIYVCVPRPPEWSWGQEGRKS